MEHPNLVRGQILLERINTVPDLVHIWNSFDNSTFGWIERTSTPWWQI